MGMRSNRKNKMSAVVEIQDFGCEQTQVADDAMEPRKYGTSRTHICICNSSANFQFRTTYGQYTW